MANRAQQSARRAWRGRTLGGAWLFRSCAALLPVVGVSGAWLGSFVIGGCFVLCGGRRQYGMIAYWRRLRPGAGRVLLLILCWRHFASFGRILCDRLLVFLKPDGFRLDSAGRDEARQGLMNGGGGILLSAHIGNWDLSSYWLKSSIANDRDVHVVMIRDDDPRVQAFVDERMRGSRITVIDPRDGLNASLAIAKALRGGHVVCMLGDRVLGDQASITVPFMGGMARFPLGPFQTAAILQVPIYVSFLIKTSERSYRLEIDEPWRICRPAGAIERVEHIERAVTRWARRLELQARRWPMQWHNFFDFLLGSYGPPTSRSALLPRKQREGRGRDAA